jgi:hypothetical protein
MPSACRSRAAARSRPSWCPVGQSGEQSLKRIESAGDRAFGGLKGLGRQAELLRTGIRTLGGARRSGSRRSAGSLPGHRSISAADAIGKTADKIGVGVEALQELRFAAKASGSSSRRWTWRCSASPGARLWRQQGTGEAKDALAQIGIASADDGRCLYQTQADFRPRPGRRDLVRCIAPVFAFPQVIA